MTTTIPAAVTPPVAPIPSEIVVTPPVAPAEPVASKENEQLDSAAEVEKWKALSRKHEAASKANADKAKAFDTLEEANKTELQKAADRAAAAETQLAQITARALRAEVAAAKGIPANLLSGSTQEELEASADALIAFKGTQPKPDMGGGDRGGDVTGANAQMTEADVKKLYAEKKYGEIEAARVAGRLNTYLGIKTTS